MDSTTKDWLLVSSLSRVGPSQCQQLAQASISPQSILAGDLAYWQNLRLNSTAIHQLQQWQQGKGPLAKTLALVENWLMASDQYHAIAFDSPDYPEPLTHLADPPPVLFVRGQLQALHLPQVALVGSRKASGSGVRQAKALSAELSRAGIVVTSGLAQGIDAAAHLAAVEQGKATIAVVGTGLDRVYPASNRFLAAQILETGGAWVSEYLPGTPPAAHHFPRRNRIISGMSLGVVVVEAALRSGSLITARQALEQDRDVFAVPGAPGHVQAKGCNQLIREGATLVTEASHIVEQLHSHFERLRSLVSDVELGESAPANEGGVSATSATGRQGNEHPLLAAIDYSYTAMETLVAQTGLPIEQLSCDLLELELMGDIEMMGDGCRRI